MNPQPSAPPAPSATSSSSTSTAAPAPQQPQPGFPLVVEVFHPYRAHERHQLTIAVGEKLTVIEKDPSGWWVGRNAKGVVGVFPSTYTKKATTVAPTQAVTRDIVSARILAELGIQDGGAAATANNNNSSKPSSSSHHHPLLRKVDAEDMEMDNDDVYAMTNQELEFEVTKLLRQREVERRVFHETLDRLVDATMDLRQKQQQQQQPGSSKQQQQPGWMGGSLSGASDNSSNSDAEAMLVVSEQQKLSMGKRSLQELRSTVGLQRSDLDELRADLRRQGKLVPPLIATGEHEEDSSCAAGGRSGTVTPVATPTSSYGPTNTTNVSSVSSVASTAAISAAAAASSSSSQDQSNNNAWLAEIHNPRLVAYAQYLGNKFTKLGDELDHYEELLESLATKHGQLEASVKEATEKRDAAAEAHHEMVSQLFDFWTEIVEAEQREYQTLKAGGVLSGPQLMAELNNQITHLERQIETGRKGYDKKTSELQTLEQTRAALKQVHELAEKIPALESEAEQKEATAQQLTEAAAAVLETSKKQMTDDQQLYRQLERKRREIYNQIQELKGNLRVYCRVKPIGKNESNEHVTVIDDMTINIYDANLEKMNTYEFDLVIPEGASQQEIFEEVRPLATSVLDGYNVCIFAYGQTGSGKTYTMEGPPENRGINFRAVKELFQVAADRGAEYSCRMTVSVLEVYNDKLFDLQNKRSPAKVRTTPDGTVLIEPMIKHDVLSVDDVQRALEKAYQSRSIAGTDCNAHSSRSHCILTVYVTATNSATNQSTSAKLHLIDLAGSERVKNSGVEGDRLKEATHINSSLTHLKTVIQGLANKSSFVAYRNSTLTSMLQDSLGGNCKCLMFANVSAATHNIPESICTMKYAAEARKVEVGKVSANVKK